MLKLFKNRKVRASATNTSIVSAGVPDSGFAFVNNSQGASAAISELSGRLDRALDKIEINGEPLDDQLRAQLDQLDEEASRYINSRLDEAKCHSWDCNAEEAVLMDIAMQCALAAYDGQYSPQVSGIQLTYQAHRQALETSAARTIRCTIASKLAPNNSEEVFPVFVLAVRGSTSFLDHMSNLNSAPKDVRDFIDTSSLDNTRAGIGNLIQAHSGFLNSASALLPAIRNQLQKAARQQVKHVMFTGHSAGGAIASLLYLHFLCDRQYESLFCYSLVTFGSPPATTPDLTSGLPKRSEGSTFNGLRCNFVNEYDLVPRASRTYVRSLVDLLRSIYRLPKIEETGTAAADWEVLQGFGARFASDGTRDAHRQHNLPVWDLPPLDLYHIGPVIVLKAAYHDDGTARDVGTEWHLGAYTVDSREFGKLLFCRVSVHARMIYVENIREIAQGRLHGRGGW